MEPQQGAETFRSFMESWLRAAQSDPQHVAILHGTHGLQPGTAGSLGFAFRDASDGALRELELRPVLGKDGRPWIQVWWRSDRPPEITWTRPARTGAEAADRRRVEQLLLEGRPPGLDFWQGEKPAETRAEIALAAVAERLGALYQLAGEIVAELPDDDRHVGLLEELFSLSGDVERIAGAGH